MTKIFAHGSYIGNTGYNNHTREFFRHLSKHVEVKVRNFTIGDSWKGMSEEPHNGEIYFNDIDRKVLYQQVLWNTDKTRNNHKMYQDPSKEFTPDVNIVLCETNHHLFYDEYVGPKIAYNVWESTLQPEGYFNKLKEFDELWVPSKWQRDCTIKQGYDPKKIKVVPEGVDINVFFPEKKSHELTSDGRFKFFLAGRWDYRKSIKEIIEVFLKTFDKDEPVDLIISVDNPFSGDGMKTTEERLNHYGLEDERIKVLHFPSRTEYIDILKSCNSFVSCARSEGWNLPLIEAMACGIPSIYSNCSGQLEFAEGKGIPVNIIGEKPVDASTYSHFNDSIGNYYEPDFEDLSKKMREVVTNYNEFKEIALSQSEGIRKKFSWERVAEIGMETINEFLKTYKEPEDTNKVYITYLNGPKVEIKGNVSRSYFIEFIDGDGKVRHSSNITNNMWTSCNVKYYVPWTIRINGKVVETFNIEDKTVLISFESKSIGDTIAWAPYAIELMNQRKCKVILSTFHNDWFIGNKSYDKIKFINPGQSVNCDVIYKLGWFRDDNKTWRNFNLHPVQPNLIPLQKTASDILGLEFKEVNYGLSFKPGKRPMESKYVVFGPQSTAGCKEWPFENWQTLTKMVRELGYEVIILSLKNYDIKDTISVTSRDWNDIFNCLYHSEFFVGLSSGLSWVNWALNKQTVMIAGFTQDDHEFTTNVKRVSNDVCIKCWNDPVLIFDPGTWDWCPVYQNTERQHICQKSITPIQVFNEILKIE
jgi:autotransporter strand-loop-strand O-heptosyltransferase